MTDLTIDDLLNSLQAPSSDTEKNPSKIWELISSNGSLEDMGFSTEEEKKDWIQNNPYTSL